MVEIKKFRFVTNWFFYWVRSVSDRVRFLVTGRRRYRVSLRHERAFAEQPFAHTITFTKSSYSAGELSLDFNPRFMVNRWIVRDKSRKGWVKIVDEDC